MQTKSVPTRDLAQLSARYPAMADVPMVGCYAFHDQNRWTVFLLSRRLDTRDEKGAATDAAITPVTLHLPFPAAAAIRVHRLAADPRQSNVPDLPTFRPEGIRPDTVTVPATALRGGVFNLTAEAGGITAGGVTGLPPGCVYAVEFEVAK